MFCGGEKVLFQGARPNMAGGGARRAAVRASESLQSCLALANLPSSTPRNHEHHHGSAVRVRRRGDEANARPLLSVPLLLPTIIQETGALMRQNLGRARSCCREPTFNFCELFGQTIKKHNTLNATRLSRFESLLADLAVCSSLDSRDREVSHHLTRVGHGHILR